MFERNTFIGNGPSVAYTCGRGAQIRLNHFSQEADLQNDGALTQIRSGAATNTVLQQNWGHDSVKGWRLDSGSNSAIVPSERNNSIVMNIALRTNGFMLKNDNNIYRRNLALDPPVGRAHGSVATEVFRVDTSRCKDENAHSIVEGNVANSWTAKNGVTSKDAPNVFDKDVKSQLRDVDNFDFRPVKGSAVDAAKAGPYLLSDTTYWIPGRQQLAASSPVPPDGSQTAKADLDLMFLAGYGCDAHDVQFGVSPSQLSRIGTLREGANVQSPITTLKGGQTYHWRVDARRPDGSVVPGPVWRFTVKA